MGEQTGSPGQLWAGEGRRDTACLLRPVCVPTASRAAPRVILTTSRGLRFPARAAEAQRLEVTAPRSHSRKANGLGFETRPTFPGWWGPGREAGHRWPWGSSHSRDRARTSPDRAAPQERSQPGSSPGGDTTKPHARQAREQPPGPGRTPHPSPSPTPVLTRMHFRPCTPSAARPPARCPVHSRVLPPAHAHGHLPLAHTTQASLAGQRGTGRPSPSTPHPHPGQSRPGPGHTG